MYQEEIKEITNRLKKLMNENEELKKISEKYNQIGKEVHKKDKSLYHCERCENIEDNYIYCPQSIINMYRDMYQNEREIRLQKEQELSEFNNLFTIYEQQEEQRQNEEVIRDPQTWEEILQEFDSVMNWEGIQN